jgi:hypothetical protein
VQTGPASCAGYTLEVVLDEETAVKLAAILEVNGRTTAELFAEFIAAKYADLRKGEKTQWKQG